MKWKREMSRVEEAQAMILESVVPLALEHLPLYEGLGSRLAQSLSTPHPLPAFRRSGMDGYAIRCADTVGASSEHPVRLQVNEIIPCGSVATQAITPGTAARIMTGAQVPAEADAVIMFELTRETEQAGFPIIEIRQEVTPGTNITPIGYELQEGELLLAHGQRITVGEIALLATFGYSTVPVYRRPRVAILPTGTELLRVDEPLQPGKIRNSNAYMLAAQVVEAGGIPYMHEPISDDLTTAKHSVEKILQESDVLLTIGGVSVGDYDVLTEIFKCWDGRTLFNKVAIRPGKHTTVGVWQHKLWFGLSGNPGACFVGFELFVRPALRAMQGDPAPLPVESTATITRSIHKGSPYPRFARGHCSVREGRLVVTPVELDQSSVTLSIAQANCLIGIPAGRIGVLADEQVRILPLPRKDGLLC